MRTILATLATVAALALSVGLSLVVGLPGVLLTAVVGCALGRVCGGMWAWALGL